MFLSHYIRKSFNSYWQKLLNWHFADLRLELNNYQNEIKIRVSLHCEDINEKELELEEKDKGKVLKERIDFVFNFIYCGKKERATIYNKREKSLGEIKQKRNPEQKMKIQ